MSAIDKLPKVADLSASDLLAMFSVGAGADTSATLATLISFIQGQLTVSGASQTQYAAPNATGFSVTVSPSVEGGNVFLLLKPLGAYASGTLVLPAVATCVDGQEIVLHSTQALTALTVNGNGAIAVNGAPSGLTQFGFFRLRFDFIDQTWYRVG